MCPEGRASLIVAHPAHELRLHGWLEQARPLVFVLTDGSGSGTRSRLPSTTHVLQRAGARAGAVYGRFTDGEIYRALLSHDIALFTETAAELGAALADAEIDYAVADAAEGYNPSHDVCRYLANAAIQIAARASGRPIAGYEYDVVAGPAASAAPATAVLTLDDEALARKIEAARGYTEMAAEVEAALAKWGPSAFRFEHLRSRAAHEGWDDPADVPAYERYGEQRLAAGTYADVIRFTDHVRPVRDALLALASAVPA